MKPWVGLFILITFVVPHALAQLDPSSTFLLNPGASDPQETGLGSGRYQTRPRSRIVEEAPIEVTPAQTPSRQRTEEPAPTPPTPEPQAAEEVSTVDLNLMKPEATLPRSEPSVLDVEASAMLLYSSSSSNSWYRTYHSPGFGMQVSGDVWIEKDWGISGFYGQTFGERIGDSFSEQAYVGQFHQDMGIGLSSRTLWKNSSLSRTKVGAFYYERTRSPERSSLMHRVWKTQGVLLRIHHLWWTSPQSADGGYFDFQFYPRAQHQDGLSGGDGLGVHRETYGLKLRWGRSRRLDDQRRIFWGLGGHVEQSRFAQRARAIEPDGSRAKGVSSFNSIIFFEFGVGWEQ